MYEQWERDVLFEIMHAGFSLSLLSYCIVNSLIWWDFEILKMLAMMHHMKLADCDPRVALYQKFIAGKKTTENDQSHN